MIFNLFSPFQVIYKGLYGDPEVELFCYKHNSNRCTGIINLCTMETLCFIFKQALVVYNMVVDCEFFRLLRNTLDAVTFDQLHTSKLPIIQFFQKLCPTWVPGRYVGVNELLNPLIKSELVFKTKFELCFTKSVNCDCGQEVQTLFSNSLVVSEDYLKQTNSVTASIRRSMFREQNLAGVCCFCHSPRHLKGR